VVPIVAVGVASGVEVPTDGLGVGVTVATGVEVTVAVPGISVPLARKELSRATLMGCMVAGSALGSGGVVSALALARAAAGTPKAP